MVKELSEATTIEAKKEVGKNETLQVFNITLKPTNGSASQNYANCYCYGPAYPPCCP